jgi:hypothetical protein
VQRAQRIIAVTPRGNDLESLKGITFNRWDPRDPWIYAGDPFQLTLIRVNSRTGKRELLSTASDQEYRWSGLNAALNDVDAFQPPFIVGEYYSRRWTGSDLAETAGK